MGILVLSFLLYRAIKEHRSGMHRAKATGILKKRFSFLTGFTIAITNPGMIIWWIIGYRLLHDLCLFDPISAPLKFLFIIAGCSGLGGYLIFIAFLLHKMQNSFSDTFISKMNVFLIFLLIIFIGDLIVKTNEKTLNSFIPNFSKYKTGQI